MQKSQKKIPKFVPPKQKCVMPLHVFMIEKKTLPTKIFPTYTDKLIHTKSFSKISSKVKFNF